MEKSSSFEKTHFSSSVNFLSRREESQRRYTRYTRTRTRTSARGVSLCSANVCELGSYEYVDKNRAPYWYCRSIPIIQHILSIATLLICILFIIRVYWRSCRLCFVRRAIELRYSYCIFVTLIIVVPSLPRARVFRVVRRPRLEGSRVHLSRQSGVRLLCARAPPYISCVYSYQISCCW